MRGTLSADIREEIRRKVDLVDLAAGHVALKKAGRHYRGLCPFHPEKTPSFHIDRDRGLWHCFGCFPPGQLVKTPFGYHPIETLREDESVVSGHGAHQRVLATYVRDYDGDLIEILTRKIRRPVQMTADHNVLVIRPTARHEVRFKYFAKRFRQYLRHHETDPGYYFRKVTKWLPIQKVEARNLRVGDLLLYPVNDRLTPVDHIDLEEYVGTRSTHGPRPSRLPSLPVNEDFLRLIGYFIAEGSTHRAYVRFSLGSHEEEFANDIVRLMHTLFGLRTAIHRRPGRSGVEITSCHASLAKAFANLCGHGAREKHIPFVFQELPLEQKRVLIDAIARGDGYRCLASRSSRTRRSITIISPVLAEQLVDMLLALRYFPSLQVKEAFVRLGVSHQEAYAVIWSEDARPRYNLIYHTENGTRYWLLPIDRLRRMKYRGPVHNLTVESDHSYVVSHVAVANCGQGGDLFDFMMRISNLSFSEAVEALAARAGVTLERTPEAAHRSSEREQLFRALQAATAFFRDQIEQPPVGAAARAYLERRGVSREIAERFALGYAPAGWDGLLKSMRAKGYPPAVLEAGGLVVARPRGDGHYDLFRDRLLFPIFDLQDRVVAFSGRALDEGHPKYLNSKETLVFTKGRTLYALNWAREAIRAHGEIVVVEGNMDVLTCHQFGITNAVASLGTALTAEQVQLMKRLASRVVLVYDSDAAGQAASERAMSLFEEAELPVRVAVLPKSDPDEFLRTAGEAAFRQLLEHALPVFEYHLTLAAARHDPRTVEGKVAIVDELIPVIAAGTNPLRQAEYVRELVQRFGVQEEALHQRLRGKLRKQAAPQVEAPLVARTDRARDRAERLVVHLMVHDAALRQPVAAALAPEEFANMGHRAIAAALFAEPDADVALVRERLADEGAQQLLMRLAFEDLPLVEKEKAQVLHEALEYITRWEPAAVRREALAREIHAAQVAGNVEQVRHLQMEYLKVVGRTPPGPKGGEDHGEEKSH